MKGPQELYTTVSLLERAESCIKDSRDLQKVMRRLSGETARVIAYCHERREANSAVMSNQRRLSRDKVRKNVDSG